MATDNFYQDPMKYYVEAPRAPVDRRRIDSLFAKYRSESNHICLPFPVTWMLHYTCTCRLQLHLFVSFLYPLHTPPSYLPSPCVTFPLATLTSPTHTCLTLYLTTQVITYLPHSLCSCTSSSPNLRSYPRTNHSFHLSLTTTPHTLHTAPTLHTPPPLPLPLQPPPSSLCSQTS